MSWTQGQGADIWGPPEPGRPTPEPLLTDSPSFPPGEAGLPGRRLWIMRRLSDGSILGAWAQQVRPTADSLPGQDETTVEVHEVPRDIADLHGGRASFLDRVPGGTAYVDASGRLAAAVPRIILAAEAEAGHGSLSLDLLVRRDGSRAFTGRASAPLGLDVGGDYLVTDDSGKGVVLKSPDGHYWALRVNNLGNLTTTDLGTSKP